ncbi:hypothetical protein [Cellulosimicrobium sp. SH8]|uniref:hypothetical protein n=1 Tax=Cellulosimicrobium sp. SH8 TaxID=2952936 RepID=UPI0021F35E37|nr:hypothetical protein [Cellulosimicrobium sp. SH8]
MTTGRGAQFDGAALREDLRASWKDATAALVLTLAIFALLYWRVAQGTSTTIEVMPFLADAPLYWMYWVCCTDR